MISFFLKNVFICLFVLIPTNLLAQSGRAAAAALAQGIGDAANFLLQEQLKEEERQRQLYQQLVLQQHQHDLQQQQNRARIRSGPKQSSSGLPKAKVLPVIIR